MNKLNLTTRDKWCHPCRKCVAKWGKEFRGLISELCFRRSRHHWFYNCIFWLAVFTLWVCHVKRINFWKRKHHRPWTSHDRFKEERKTSEGILRRGFLALVSFGKIFSLSLQDPCIWMMLSPSSTSTLVSVLRAQSFSSMLHISWICLFFLYEFSYQTEWLSNRKLRASSWKRDVMNYRYAVQWLKKCKMDRYMVRCSKVASFQNPFYIFLRFLNHWLFVLLFFFYF